MRAKLKIGIQRETGAAIWIWYTIKRLVLYGNTARIDKLNRRTILP